MFTRHSFSEGGQRSIVGGFFYHLLLEAEVLLLNHGAAQ